MSYKIDSSVSLKAYNTFGIDVAASKFTIIRDVSMLSRVLSGQCPPYKVIGGGSNILLTDHVKEHILLNRILGIELISKKKKKVKIRVGGGENWHEFVLWTIKNGYGGIENLSLIPGTVGAAPIQNIGAYGVEQKEVFISLNAIDLDTGKVLSFNKEECEFGYRDSIFKHDWKGKLLITDVTYELNQEKYHSVRLSYGDIKKVLDDGLNVDPSIVDVSNAVIQIRTAKLPDPATIGNCGSFFKNPIIATSVFRELKVKFPNMPHYPAGPKLVKVPAGWLIDQCGWKGKRKGDAGTYKNQALVLVNHGHASGKELLSFAEEIIASVEDRYGITLSPEVNIW